MFLLVCDASRITADLTEHETSGYSSGQPLLHILPISLIWLTRMCHKVDALQSRESGSRTDVLGKVFCHVGNTGSIVVGIIQAEDEFLQLRKMEGVPLQGRVLRKSLEKSVFVTARGVYGTEAPKSWMEFNECEKVVRGNVRHALQTQMAELEVRPCVQALERRRPFRYVQGECL